MLVLLSAEERAARTHVFGDVLVGLEDELARVRSGLGGEVAGGIDRIENRQAVLYAGVKVVGAVSGRGVHRAGTRLEIDVVGQYDERIAIHERMAHVCAVEPFAGNAREQRGIGEAFSQRLGRKRGRENQQFVVETIETVRRVSAQRDRDVGRQRPRRGRPDQDRQFAALLVTERLRYRFALGVVCWKAHVDRRRDLRLVFDLGFGQRRFVVQAPQRRAQTLVELLLLGEIGERVDDGRFERRVDREVRPIVVPERAHALTCVALPPDPKQGALFALLAQFERIDRVKVGDAQKLERLEFDR